MSAAVLGWAYDVSGSPSRTVEQKRMTERDRSGADADRGSRGVGERLRCGLGESLGGNATAFGYSVTITASFGAVEIGRGSPTFADLIVFGLGSVIAYEAARRLARGRGEEDGRIVAWNRFVGRIELQSDFGRGFIPYAVQQAKQRLLNEGMQPSRHRFLNGLAGPIFVVRFFFAVSSMELFERKPVLVNRRFSPSLGTWMASTMGPSG